MILAPVGRGGLDADYTDERTPGHIPGRYGEVDAVPVAHRVNGCERHLFDVVERAVDDVDPLPHPDDFGGDDAYLAAVDTIESEVAAGWYRQLFDARLVCARCGHVEAWRGTRQVRTLRTLDPVPLVSGQLRAQQVEGGVFPTFTVYDAAGARVGVLTWARGPRGRRYFEGRLGSLSGAADDLSAAGDSPLAVLRKLARLHTSRDAEPDPISTVDLTPDPEQQPGRTGGDRM